jgi:capsular exopolysaccharide synthesis family protein
MELLEYWRTLKKRLWLILLLVVIAVAGAIYYVQQQVPLYSTATMLFLNPISPSPLLPYQTTASAQSLANTYVQFMRTRSFAGQVAEALAFPMSDGEILGAISSELVPETQFFRISVVHRDPQVAQVLANTAAQVLIAENLSRQQAQREQIAAQRDPAKLMEQERLTELEKTLQDELSYADDRIASLQQEITDLQSKPPSAEIDQQILTLRAELLTLQSQRVDLFGSVAQTQAALASIEEVSNTLVDTAVVVDPAPLPTRPQGRQPLRYVLLAMVGALGLGVALAFLLEYIDYTIKTPEELDGLYGMATLGVIGWFKGENGRKDGGNHLVALSDPRSPITEAFRALRTNIQFASPGNPVRSLLVTSAGPSEGKTSVAANLAVIVAQGGKRVILVDTDLRRPRIHRLFEMKNSPGFTDLLIDEGDGVEGYIKATDVENLEVVTSGPLPRNPAELLGSERAARVMELLGRRADVVIYDSPPAATVTDAVVMASRVDAVVQVVQAGGPRRDVVLRAKALLEKVGARLLGPVLNQVNLSDLGYYTYYYYHGYDQEEQEVRPQTAWQRLLRRPRREERHREEAAEKARP